MKILSRHYLLGTQYHPNAARVATCFVEENSLFKVNFLAYKRGPFEAFHGSVPYYSQQIS